MEHDSNTIQEPRPWRWGPCLLSTWSCLLFLVIILAFAVPRLRQGGWSFPLYAAGEYVEGCYPLFWLVYLCLPLLARDIYLSRKHKRPLGPGVKLSLSLILIVFLPVYHFIFGWF